MDGLHLRPQAVQWEQGLHMEALANLAHELRSPVQAILGYLDILRDELGEVIDDRYKQILERMNTNAHDLAQTVENVMDFSVADAMAEVAEEEEIRPHDLIGDLVPVLEAANDSKHLEIKFDLEAAPTVFRSRRRPIKSILLNLAVNAVKFTDRGSVTIAIRRLRRPTRLRRRAGSSRHRTRYRGGVGRAGIPDLRSAIALEYPQSPRYGLGLAVVQRNVEALGAKIIVKTVLQEGSAFVVVVPIAKPLSQAQA